jgi:hypothetical protein
MILFAAGLWLCMSGVPGTAATDTTSTAWKQYESELAGAHKRLGSAKPSAPQERTRAALSACLDGRRAELTKLYRQCLELESRANDDGSLRESDSILYLFNSTLTDREDFLLAQELAAKDARNEELRLRILLSLLDDEYYELNQLKGQNRYNKFTRIFNRASSSLTKLAMFQPQDAAQLLLDGVYSLRKAKVTTNRERKMVYVGNVFLEKYPEAPEAAEVRELLANLRIKLNADEAKREQSLGKLYADHGNYVAAEFHMENAALTEPGNAETSSQLTALRHESAAAETALARSLAVSPAEKHFDSETAGLLGQAVKAAVTADLQRMEKLAGKESKLQDSAAYACASLIEAGGKHDEALQRFAAVAASGPDSPGGRASAAVLRNPAYNLDQQFALAAKEMREERKKFILTGRRSSDESAYLYGSAAIQGTASGAGAVGALFFTDILVRGIAEQFRTQVGVDEVVDAGARYLRKYPSSSRSRQIAYEISELSRQSGGFAQSKDYLEQAGADTPERLAKLRENEARKYHDQAMSAGDPAARKQVLQHVVDKYGDTKIAKTAAKELAKLQPTIGENSIVLTRKMLSRDAEILTSLGLSPGLADGKKSNGELDDLGVAFDPPGKRFAYRLKGETEYRVSDTPSKDRERLLTRAKELRDTYLRNEEAKETLIRQKLPFAVEGGAGSSGVSVSPKLIPAKERDKDSRYFR